MCLRRALKEVSGRTVASQRPALIGETIETGVTENEHECLLVQHLLATLLPKLLQDFAKVRASIEVEFCMRNHMPIFERHFAQAIDIGEHAHSAKVR